MTSLDPIVQGRNELSAQRNRTRIMRRQKLTDRETSLARQHEKRIGTSGANESGMNSALEGAIISPQSRVIGHFTSLLSSALNVSRSTGTVKQPLQSVSEKLPFIFSRSIDAAALCCSVPSLQLKQKDPTFFPRSSKPLVEDAAALNLGTPLRVHRSDLKSLPITLLWNLSRSFLSLVDSRLRSSQTALVRQSRSRHREDDAHSRVLVGLLAASSTPINPTAVVTTFRALAFSERVDEGDYILPIVMEAVFDLDVLGHFMTVTIEAPGTIQGSFVGNNHIAGPVELLKIEVQLDTSAMLKSMMTEARSVVRKALVVATEIATNLLHSTPSRVSYHDTTDPLMLQGSGERSVREMRLNSTSSDTSANGSSAANNSDTCSEHPQMLPPPARGKSEELSHKRSTETSDKTSDAFSLETKNAPWGKNNTCGDKEDIDFLENESFVSDLSGVKRECLDQQCLGVDDDILSIGSRKRLKTSPSEKSRTTENEEQPSTVDLPAESSRDQDDRPSRPSTDVNELCVRIAKV